MFVVIAREPKPDAVYWPGRRLLASMDAVVWPILAALLVLQAPTAEGLLRPVVAVVVLWAGLRVCTAVFANHRYRFTTWLATKMVAVLLVVGLVMKLALPA